MLWAIALILLLLWALGLATASTLAGAIQVLAVVALALFLIRILKGYHRRRRPLTAAAGSRAWRSFAQKGHP